MGSGRDKRKKHEDPNKALQRAQRQAVKASKAERKTKQQGAAEGGDDDEMGGLNNEESVVETLNKIRKQEEKKKETIIQEIVGAPPPRANVVFQPNPIKEQELLLFGGELWDGITTLAYNDMFLFHTTKNVWSQVRSPINPSPRSSAQGVVYKHFLLVHGGEFVSQSQAQFLHFRDVWRFDCRTYQWEEMKALKNGPSSRSGHRMCLWKRQAVLFGGFYDNAQECKYFNDLWTLSDLDTNGRWRHVAFPPQADLPHERSGHSVGVFQDTFYVFGGYSSHTASRFKKAEATVHHDLWMVNLASDSALWQRVKLAGIPPPIRCGVSGVLKDKRLFLFGGVVDMETPGGKMMSTFSNDLFSFQMETKKFYPIVLHMSSKTTKGEASKGEAKLSLEQELAMLKLGGKQTAAATSSEDSSSSDDEEFESGSPSESAETKAENQFSYTTNAKGQVLPFRRMDAALAVQGHHLYVFGGQYEVGKKEITLADLFSLNLNTCDTYTVHSAQDMGKLAWAGEESDSDAGGSWESGSTVVSAVMDGDRGDLSDEEDDDEGPQTAADDGTTAEGEEGESMPMELDPAATVDDLAPSGRTTGGNKRGMKVHKAQLLSQLSADAAVPTPLNLEESKEGFYKRSSAFWLRMAAEALFGVADDSVLSSRERKRCRQESVQYASNRHEEAVSLMEQLKIVEDREKEEEEYFRELRERKKRDWEEELEKQRQLAAAETEETTQQAEEEEAPIAVPAHRMAAPTKSILKTESKPSRSVQIQ